MMSQTALESADNRDQPSGDESVSAWPSDYAPDQSLGERVAALHQRINAEANFGSITRIGIATYDETTDLLRSFAASDLTGAPLGTQEARLAALPGLAKLARERLTRVINDFAMQPNASKGVIVDRLMEAGVRASLTFPIHFDDRLIGFCFLDSNQTGVFDEAARARLWPFMRLLSQLLLKEYEVVVTIRAALKSAQAMIDYKDSETASHLNRMAFYSRLIASGLAETDPTISDEFVELVYWSAAFHDIGKIAVPDAILTKPGKLTGDEYEIMKSHVARGLEITDTMVRNFSFAETPQIAITRNIVACHHECLDGSGYPNGLRGDAIPLEGRIVAVADVFDALTGERPYKSRWKAGDALDYLEQNAGTRFDRACVAALKRKEGLIPGAWIAETTR